MSERIVVAGGGPVGLAFALAAASLRDVGVTVIERQAVQAHDLPPGYDHRVFAVSPGSRAFLEALDVWRRIPAERIAPVRAMQVSGDDGGELALADGMPVAFILEHGALMNALLQAVGERADRISVVPGSVATLIETADSVAGVALQGGLELPADLVVGADGSRSQVRTAAGIGAHTKPYDSEGVVANFKAQHPHGDTARQWFGGDSVLAFLPLPDGHISIVWSVTSERARVLKSMAPEVFAAAVQSAGHNSLGALTLVSPVAGFPLQRMEAAQWVKPGLALMGDAAHAIHPLAGQGVNLGFGDAQCLFETLRERGNLSAIGDLAVLRRYERTRREPTWAMAETTDGLRALHLSPWQPARWARNRGISAVDRLPLVKSMLMNYAKN